MKTPEERIIEDCVKFPSEYTIYSEIGLNFRRFIDRQTGKTFDIKVIEVKSRKRRKIT